MTSKAKPVTHPKLTPLPDPPEENLMEQFPYFAEAAMTLRAYFRHALGRDDVLVNGDGYLCRRASEVRRSPRPDCLVALNLPFDPDLIDEANGYTVEEVGQPADFVLEIGSKSTGRRDYTVKRDIYAALEVKEYWRFDHTGGRYHDAPLAGDLLVEGAYERIPVELGDDGIHRGFSAALGLELHWKEGTLRFKEPGSGDYLPNLPESWAQADEAKFQLEQAEDRRQQAENQRQQAENQRRQAEDRRQLAETERDEAQARVRELEEEIRRLQGQ